MKNLTKIIAASLLAGSLLTVAGCSRGTTVTTVATFANWNVRTSTVVESNEYDFWRTHKEVASYSISFKEGTNNSYSVSYDTANATYTTKFYMDAEDYDWTSSSIPENYRVTADDNTVTKEPVYVYETEMHISGVYKDKDGNESAFDDEIISVCKYRTAEKNLQPVYSKQIVKNTTPAALSTGNVDGAYVKVDAVYETFYNFNCTEAFVKTQNNSTTKEEEKNTERSVKIKDKKNYSAFDNSQLRAALRALTMTEDAVRTFNVVLPQSGNVQTCTAKIAAPVELKEDVEGEKQIIDALDACQPDDYIFFDHRVDSEGKKVNYRYSAMQLEISAYLKGTAPTVWYTTVENQDVNTTRSILLRMSSPIAFGMGTLIYELKSLNLE